MPPAQRLRRRGGDRPCPAGDRSGPVRAGWPRSQRALQSPLRGRARAALPDAPPGVRRASGLHARDAGRGAPRGARSGRPLLRRADAALPAGGRRSRSPAGLPADPGGRSQRRASRRTLIHFATVFTPGADPDRRRGDARRLRGLGPLEERRDRPAPPAARLRHSHRRGPPLRRPPVAPPRLGAAGAAGDLDPPAPRVGSRAAGLRRARRPRRPGEPWAPVHAFCESREIPCLFPQTDLPVTARRAPPPSTSPAASCRKPRRSPGI